MNKKIFIKVNTIFKALHNWEGCDIPEVMFLKYPHHHEFEISVKMYISHDDRDIEFICYQRWLDNFLEVSFPEHNLGSRSCEMLAKMIADASIKEFGDRDITVEFSEDGHYSGGVEYAK